ncbi:MAG: phage tail protein [Candidatus Dormibacteria bacterium]
MSFDIGSFRAQLQEDGARPNLFEVSLQFPSWVSTGGLAGQKSSFLVKAAQLPGSTIGVAPLFYFGREVKLAGNRQYQDWTVQVINDEDFVIRNALELWINGINDPAGNIRNPNAGILDGGYGVDAIVSQFGKTGAIIKTYNLIGVWPYDLSAIELDWGANDTVEEFAVTWAVQYMGDPVLSDLTA